MTFKPMLAAECTDALGSLCFPLLASPKLDGIRCVVKGGKALTRSLKEIPNRAIFEALSRPEYEGYDGEIIVGTPTDKDVYRRTNSQVMSRDGGLSDVVFFVFDNFNEPQANYERRQEGIGQVVGPGGSVDIPIGTLSNYVVNSLQELEVCEANFLKAGYEGVMLRDPQAPYKFGRSTLRQQALLKLKRFTTSEAEVIGMLEEMANLNEAKTNALGYTERSTHAQNKQGKGRLGAITVRDLQTGVEFEIGSGFTAQEREQFWREDLQGQIVRYRHFPIGVKDKPRFPVFDGLRSKEDMS